MLPGPRITLSEYYHVELDTHDVLLAEGAPSERFLDDDSRGMFHNAREFAALYPDAPAPGCFSTPKVDEGYELEAVRRRLAVVPGRWHERRSLARIIPPGTSWCDCFCWPPSHHSRQHSRSYSAWTRLIKARGARSMMAFAIKGQCAAPGT